MTRLKTELKNQVPLFLWAILLLSVNSVTLKAQTLLFDDFSDPAASAAVWTLSPLTPGNYEIVPGEGLILTPTTATGRYRGGRFMYVEALDVTPSDVSIRARVRKNQLEGGGAGDVGFGVRVGPDRNPAGSPGTDGYVAWISPSGELGIYPAGLPNEARAPTDLDVSQEDVMLRLDVVGNILTLWAWPPDALMPAKPNVTLSDDSFESGWIALVGTGGRPGGPNEFAQTIFRFVHIVRPRPGDFDVSGEFDIADIDALSAAIRGATEDRAFDLTGDGLFDRDDLTFWVKEVKETWFGDANLDRQFNSADLVSVFQAGQYEDAIAGNSTWATGDWNGDGEFTTGDLVLAFQDGGYEQGPRLAAATVPEPAGHVLAVVASLALVGFRGGIGRDTGTRVKNRRP